MDQLSKDILHTCHETLIKAQDFIELSKNFNKTCNVKYTGACEIKLNKDILKLDELVYWAERLSDLCTEHLKKCGMNKCVDACRNCSEALQDLLNAANDLISDCAYRQKDCGALFKEVEKNCKNIIEKIKVCAANYCNM